MERESGIRVDGIFSFIPYEREAIRQASEVSIAGTQHEKMFSYTSLWRIGPRDLEDVKGMLNQQSVFERGHLNYRLESFSETPGRDMRSEFLEIENTLKRKS